MSRADTEKVFQMAITNLIYGQNYAARLKGVVPQDLLSAALDRVDSAVLDLEGLRDEWRRDS